MSQPERGEPATIITAELLSYSSVDVKGRRKLSSNSERGIPLSFGAYRTSFFREYLRADKHRSKRERSVDS
jgi:hypothetical protein